MTARARRRGAGDAGVVLIVVALLMVALLTIVGIVIDLGQLRADRRDDQKAADLAALAGGYYLAGYGSLGNSISDPQKACMAALGSIKANSEGFPSAATMPCSSLPDDARICVAYAVDHPGYFQTIPSTGSSQYAVTIKYPVPAGEINETAFVGGIGANDGDDQCSRMSVSVQSTRPTFFAGIIGVNSQTIAGTAVVKGSLNVKTKDVAALLLLERSNCRVLYTSGQGNVIIEPSTGSGANNPGRIQIDSEGKGTCTSNTNQDGYVLYAPATGNSGRIEVQDTATKPGLIGLYSLTPGINGKGGAVVTNLTALNGVSTTPLAAQISSRWAMDDRYNNSTISNADRVTALHARAYAAVTGTQPAGSTLVSGAGCSPSGTTSILGTTVYVDCPEFVADNTSFPAATSIYFKGKITVANNKTLSLPVAERVYVRGCLSPSSGTSANCGNNASGTSNAYAINVNGTMLVNTSSYAACPTQTASSRITEIATLGGPVVVSGNVAFCSTFIYAGRNAATYSAQQKTNGAPNCSEDLPCPQDGNSWVDEGYITTPSGGNLFWSAPNRITDPPSATNPFEDVAFWGESSRDSSVKGTGSSKATGVFFLPNSNVTFLGQGDQLVPQNAQFISRSLNLSGQGTMRLKPNPDDAVQTPSPGGWNLIR